MRDVTHLQRLLPALADASTRREVARHAARAVGATDLFAFVPDSTRTKLLPAAGFIASLPSSRGWRELIDRGRSSGIHRADVAYPTAGETSPAIAHGFPQLCLVFVGGDADEATHRTVHDAITPYATLLAALLGAETELRAARGELAVERHTSERAAALARALDLARAESEHATRVKDEFLAMLGHELRNPLAPIVTALQLLRLDGVSTHAQDVIERQVAHMTRLVDDLLDMSRITSGKIELRKQPLEAHDIVQRAIEMARPLLEARQSRISLDIPPNCLVEGDPARLAQVVTNLVTNAAKYSEPGAPIWLSAATDGVTVRITCADQGKGIRRDYLDRIFDRFVQTPQGIDRGEGGLGLGLAIVKSLVGLHGGRVSADSAGPGHGSRFVIELPSCVAPSAEADRVISTAPVSPASKADTGSNVLVVDDNVDAAELLAEILTTFGHRVRVAADGLAALDLLASFTPDAALLDIGLPVMDGYELARRLRDKVPEIRLVALTGYGRPDDRRRSSEAGFDAHLVKPVSIRRVTDTLDKLLGERAASRHAVELDDLTPIPVLVPHATMSPRD